MTDDPYDVQLTAPALRALGRIPEKLADAVLALCAGPLAENPLRVTKPLTGQLSKYRSAYVGIAYRMLVRVDHDRRIVYVVRVAHRADAYRPL
ncbi:MAG TPA: type II toxin-antitoxin system RelE/ParE family toxin [Candidatus Ruania gallistercoris]|uniref:Type II toxin-antitoxin system RelE/ParE family toxin n=1 Tax=Candidatus Ruania gallistercoris TaxID=2838746 RepID=A0A9D2EG35_9MICO|nr:type II toxin-antitoxin system RelE/ParE family toxin [Candidatus Ruania gallistercoris]